MTTLPDRPGTALVVIDVQNGVVADAHQRDHVVGTIAGLVDRARAEHVPVIWVRHRSEHLVPDTDAWQLVPELIPASDEPIVDKQWGDAFEATELEATLADHRVGRLVIAGAQTDACIRSTLHGALVRGYDTVLVGDGHTTEDLSQWGAPPPDQVIAHTNLYWADHSAPGRAAEVALAADVDLAPVA